MVQQLGVFFIRGNVEKLRDPYGSAVRHVLIKGNAVS